MAGRKRNERYRSPAPVFVRVLVAVLIFLFALAFAAGFLSDSVAVTDESMNPALREGDTVLVFRLAYLLRNPRRGDMIQFQTGSGSGTDLIRRVIGLPGETIQITESRVYVNGTALDESAYAGGTMQYSGTASLPLTLSEDEYFVMADNRSSNFDSRDPTVGSVSLSDIRGQVWFRTVPFGRFGPVR